MYVMRERKSLSHIDEKGATVPVFINDDLTKRDQFINYQARKFAKEQRVLGKEVKLGYRKVFVDGKPILFNEETNNFTTEN